MDYCSKTTRSHNSMEQTYKNQLKIHSDCYSLWNWHSAFRCLVSYISLWYTNIHADTSNMHKWLSLSFYWMDVHHNDMGYIVCLSVCVYVLYVVCCIYVLCAGAYFIVIIKNESSWSTRKTIHLLRSVLFECYAVGYIYWTMVIYLMDDSSV